MRAFQYTGLVLQPDRSSGIILCIKGLPDLTICNWSLPGAHTNPAYGLDCNLGRLELARLTFEIAY